MNNKYLIPQNITAIMAACSYADLFTVAQDILSRMPEDVYQVCGPISTGPRNIEENLAIFNKTVQVLALADMHIFNQIPFEAKMIEFKKQYFADNPTATYCTPLLTEFYLPLFKTKRIKKFFFLPDWEQSTGSVWEHDRAHELGIAITYLPKDWLDHFDITKID